MAGELPFLSRRELFERLARGPAGGVTVVTPNRRLAQTLQREFDLQQAASGRHAWETADILPFAAFVQRLWEDALYSDRAADLALLLTPNQEQALWEDIIRGSDLGASLLSAGSAAAQCSDAWALMHAWRLAPKLSAAVLGEDARAFADWSARYARLTRDKRQTDAARLPDALVPLLGHASVCKPATLVLFGFDTLTPQQREFLDAAAQLGIEPLASRTERVPSKARRLDFASSGDEILAAARWARARLESGGPGIRIGVVVPDLAQSRARVWRTFASVLQPASLLPTGAAQPAPPFDVSLGLPLTNQPLVHDALLALQLACGEIPFNDASRLLRSPFLMAADSESAVRARLDARLRERSGVALTLDRLLNLLARDDMPQAPALLTGLRELNTAGRPPPGTKTAVEWAQHFAAALRTLGYPGERPLDSAEYQTLKKWHEVLAALAALERVSGKMHASQALQRLRRVASDTLFQPETPAVPIQILGALESAGLAFDHLWVTGLTDEAWPLPARPNPFVPLRLQKAAGVPFADAGLALERGRRMTQDWLACAPEVIVSHARMKDDSELAPSPLIREVEAASFGDLGVPADPGLSETLFHSRRLEKIADQYGPALAAGQTPSGGTALFRDQAACPFRAFARHRLGSAPLELPRPGLDAAERGTLVHQMFALVWSALGDQRRLLASGAEELDRLLNACAQEAIAKLRRQRPDALPDRFALIESQRLAAMAREWLNLEKARPGFEVVALERKQPVSFGGVTVNARLDRMDALAGGERIVIDYKTGACAVSSLLGPRPDEPQLPMYALSAEQTVAAVAFAQLKAGEFRFRGLANAEGLLPDVTLVSKDRSPSARQYSGWDELQRAWRTALEALGRGFAAGDARVDPKYGVTTCQQCDQQSFCRVAEKALAAKEEGGHE